MKLKLLTTTLLLASLPVFAAEKDYDDVLEAHYKRIGQANRDYAKWSHEKPKVDNIKADIKQMEQELNATAPASLNTQFTTNMQHLNQARSFLRAVEGEKVNVTEALDSVCGKDNKCYGTGKTRDQLRTALSDYNHCKKVINENSSFNLFGDKCSATYLDSLKEAYEGIEADSAKKTEESKAQRKKIEDRIALQKKNLSELEALGAKVSRQNGARDEEFVNTILSMRLKHQGETFDQKLLLLDVDKIVSDYGQLGADAKSAAAMIDGIANKASQKISETVFGSFVNQQIGRALQNACDEGLFRQCLGNPDLVDGSSRAIFKDITEGLKKAPDAKAGATKQ